MNRTDEDRPGLVDRVLGSAARLGATVLGTAHTRIELLGVELREEMHRGASLALRAAVALLAAAFALFFAGFTIIVMFWDTHRLLAAVAVTLALALIAVVALLSLRRQLARRPRFLDATLRELEADIEALGRTAGPADRREARE